MQEESECIVCFSNYDDEEHRPRSMPCGHTMCSKCLETTIREHSKTCPKCRTLYTASNVKDLPVNFSLEGMVKSVNISDKLPECIEHQLPVSHRCTTHKSWICQSCLTEDHSSESCKIITVSEELNIKKSTQLNQSRLLLNAFEETCKKFDDCKKQCKKLIEKDYEEISRCEIMVKRLQEEIERKKTLKMQKENKYAMFDQKLDMLKGKRSSYDKAVTSLKSSENIRGVSKCSIEVQNEAEKLQLISHDIDKEVDLMLQAVTAESGIGLSLGYHKLSISDGKHHLHAPQGKNTSKPPIYKLELTDGNDPLSTDGILTFLDIAWPGQEPRRIYMKMLGNTVRARQHLLLVTGQCGHSYKDLTFSRPQNQGQPDEYIVMHPYDGNKAAPLLKDVTVNDDVSRKLKAGLLHGAGWGDDYNTALFAVYLRDYPGKTVKSCFGVVTSGLDILQELAKSDQRDQIKVVDCGIVLFY